MGNTTTSMVTSANRLTKKGRQDSSVSLMILTLLLEIATLVTLFVVDDDDDDAHLWHRLITRNDILWVIGVFWATLV